MSKELRIRVRISAPPGLVFCGLVTLALGLGATELSSESVTLSTYYPAPSGVYGNMLIAGQTWLARDSSYLTMGVASGVTPPAGTKVAVLGRVGLNTSSPGDLLEVNQNNGAGSGGLYVRGAYAAVQFQASASALGVATGAGWGWSTDAAGGDVVLRSAGQVLVQTGVTGAAITVSATNQVGIGKGPSQTLDVSDSVVLRGCAGGAVVGYGPGTSCTDPALLCVCPAGDYATWIPGIYNTQQNQSESYNPAIGGVVDSPVTTGAYYGVSGWGEMACCPIPAGATRL